MACSACRTLDETGKVKDDPTQMALNAADKMQTGAVDSLRQGLGLIHHQLRGVLAEAGLEEIEALMK